MPDFASELALMAENITGSRARPARRRFNQLVDALEKADARYVICGATAMGAHGAERFTHDIDVLVAEDDLERTIAALSGSMRELGREPKDGPAKQVRLRSKRAKTHAGVDIDLMVPVDVIEAWALTSGVRARAFDRKVDVASVEALILMKLNAYVSAPEHPRSGIHRGDAAALLSAVPEVDIALMPQFIKDKPELRAALDGIITAGPWRGRLG
jgi:hypothetical protein